MKTPITLAIVLVGTLAANGSFDPMELPTDVSRVIELPTPNPAPVDADLVDYPAHLVYRVAPHYPRELKMRGIMGTVQLEVVVDTIGRVRSVEILHADHAAFGQAAVEAALDWSFEPALMDGRPVPVRVTIPFRFVIPTLLAQN